MGTQYAHDVSEHIRHHAMMMRDLKAEEARPKNAAGRHFPKTNSFRRKASNTELVLILSFANKLESDRVPFTPTEPKEGTTRVTGKASRELAKEKSSSASPPKRSSLSDTILEGTSIFQRLDAHLQDVHTPPKANKDLDDIGICFTGSSSS